MRDLFALVIIILWPLIPLFWIPVHLITPLFRRLGILTYVLLFTIWAPLGFFIYKNRSLILGPDLTFPLVLRMAGWALFISGLLLQFWAIRLLSLWGLIGLSEISDAIEGRLITTGAFSMVRHPTYLAHTMIFSGVFLITGVVAVGIITILDLLFVLTLIIPLEERELFTRFGEEYRYYKERVPMFLPFKLKTRNESL